MITPCFYGSFQLYDKHSLAATGPVVWDDCNSIPHNDLHLTAKGVGSIYPCFPSIHGLESYLLANIYIHRNSQRFSLTLQTPCLMIPDGIPRQEAGIGNVTPGLHDVLWTSLEEIVPMFISTVVLRAYAIRMTRP